MIIPGSEHLTRLLHIIGQSLLIPCILGLLSFLIFSFVELGGFTAEIRIRKREKFSQWEEILQQIIETTNKLQLIKESDLPLIFKEIALHFLNIKYVSRDIKKVMARKLLEQQEFKMMKSLEKTEIIAKLGPILGLIGTLIPLGPGLAALSQGNVNELAKAIMVAFDTTVAGLAAGGIAYFITKIRRRWYEEQLSDLEALLEVLVEVKEDVR
ncbi:MAG: MotA/TolQ/ExbB proton channel family protein [Desulfotomaculum sp.]|nr:MotA/TolQ/ExbB proton channel family protein [Desulfotomaculum sp.]